MDNDYKGTKNTHLSAFNFNEGMARTRLFRSLVKFGMLISLGSFIGCASSGGKVIPQVLFNIAENRSVDVASVMKDEINGRNAALARMERGRIAQLLGDSATSMLEFNGAIEKIKEFDEQASVSLSDVGAHSAALLVNDNAIPYRPAGFERVLVYHSQAINYLMEGKVESAGVEVRRANAEQADALKAHEEELRKATEQAKSKALDVTTLMKSFPGQEDGSKEAADSVKNSFQNAYTFYLSALVHEQMGQQNDAYIDYKKALEIAPKNSVIQRDVIRLAKSLSMRDDLAKYNKKYPTVASDAKSIDPTKNDVVILIEDGAMPAKQQMQFPIPIPIPSAPGLTSVAIPIFKRSNQPMHPYSIVVDNKELIQSQSVCSLDALAAKAFEEQFTPMITRQIVRATLKGAASSITSHAVGRAAESSGLGALAGLGVGALGAATEIADTRSWLSLPHNVQVARLEVSPGTVLKLRHISSDASGSITAPSEAGKRLLIRVIRIGGKLLLKSVTL